MRCLRMHRATPVLSVFSRAVSASAMASAAPRVNLPPGLVVRTPLLESRPLSALAGVDVLLKMDCMQASGSFKDRGMAYLCQEMKAKGVESIVSSSGGNAGHAAAAMARKLGMSARVIVPETTKPIMLEKIRSQE
jgi:L-serine/L-threonine ammonia-lyase